MLPLIAVLWLAQTAAPAPAAQASEVQITARLLGPDEKPLAGESVRCTLHATDGSLRRGWKNSTDANGLLAWSLGTRLSEQDFAQLAFLVERPDGAAFHVAVPLPEPVDGKVDLGDTPLRLAPVMVFGRVLDPAGRPAPDETVEWSGIFELPGREGPMPSSVRHCAGRLRTDAQGRFELRGIERGLRSHLQPAVRACSAVYAPTRWQSYGGAEAEVVLQFAEPGSVQGRVVAPDGVDPTTFRLDAFYPDQIPLLEDSGSAFTLGHDGGFELRFPPEPCSLALWIDPRNRRQAGLDCEPELVLEDVVPGQQTVEWDLRSVLHVYELAVLTPEGTPAQLPRLFYSSGGRAMSNWGSGPEGAPVHRILSVDRPLTVRVEKEGYRTATLKVDGPRGELKLKPGLAVTIAVTNLPDLGEGGFLALTIWSEEIDAEATGTIDRHGSGQVIAPEPGIYEILVVHQRQVGGTIWSGVASWWVGMPELDVYDRESQTKKLTLPKSLVEAIQRDLEQHR